MQSRGHQQKLRHLFARINTYHHSFLPASICDWNSLPREIVESFTLQDFIKYPYMHTHKFEFCALQLNYERIYVEKAQFSLILNIRYYDSAMIYGNLILL